MQGPINIKCAEIFSHNRGRCGSPKLIFTVAFNLGVSYIASKGSTRIMNSERHGIKK